MKKISADPFDAVATGLQDFGYKHVTAEQIRKAHAAWQKGEPPGDIIEKFAFKDFAEHPDLFGKKAGA